jgi:hypothetical protein
MKYVELNFEKTITEWEDEIRFEFKGIDEDGNYAFTYFGPNQFECAEPVLTRVLQAQVAARQLMNKMIEGVEK